MTTAATTTLPQLLTPEELREHLFTSAGVVGAWNAYLEVDMRLTLLEHEPEPTLESPIEQLFWHGWALAHAICVGDTARVVTTLTPQVTVPCGARGQEYRLDFVVSASHADGRTWAPQIAIEVDGHEFHEKTKAQVTYRNKRDRDLQSAGWRVYHFSGAEIVRDPVGCLKELMFNVRTEARAYFAAMRKAQVQS